jgi:hypothetical protein
MTDLRSPLHMPSIPLIAVLTGRQVLFFFFLRQSGHPLPQNCRSADFLAKGPYLRTFFTAVVARTFNNIASKVNGFIPVTPGNATQNSIVQEAGCSFPLLLPVPWVGRLLHRVRYIGTSVRFARTDWEKMKYVCTYVHAGEFTGPIGCNVSHDGHNNNAGDDPTE